MSENLAKLLADLNEDWKLIGEFFDNPNRVTEKYGLSKGEKEILLSRNLDDLNAIGISD